MPLYRIIVRGGKSGRMEAITVHADNPDKAVAVLRKRLEYWRKHGTPDQRTATIDSVREKTEGKYPGFTRNTDLERKVQS